jgi:hypothetical protein
MSNQAVYIVTTLLNRNSLGCQNVYIPIVYSLLLKVRAYCLNLCGLYFGNCHFMAALASLVYRVVGGCCNTGPCVRLVPLLGYCTTLIYRGCGVPCEAVG